MKCNFSKQLMIEISPNGDLYFTHCCVLFEERIQCSRVEDLLNAENVKEYLNKIYHTNPENHNFHPKHNDCNGEKNCDFESDGDFDFLTVSHKACNIHCKSCVVDRTEGAENIKNASSLYIKVLNKLKGIGLRHLQISSVGEPFLFKSEVIKYISELTPEDTQNIGFVTNAISLNKEDIDFMCEKTKQNGVQLHAILSCDGISKESYIGNRGIDTFSKVIENIYAFRDNGQLVCVNYVITPFNINELKEAPEWWISKGITPHFIFPICKPEWEWMREHENVRFIKENYSKYFSNN